MLLPQAEPTGNALADAVQNEPHRLKIGKIIFLRLSVEANFVGAAIRGSGNSWERQFVGAAIRGSGILPRFYCGRFCIAAGCRSHKGRMDASTTKDDGKLLPQEG